MASRIHGIQFVIDEPDGCANARNQSSILHLHSVSGQRATREVDLYKQFRCLVAGATTTLGTYTQEWSDFGLKVRL